MFPINAGLDSVITFCSGCGNMNECVSVISPVKCAGFTLRRAVCYFSTISSNGIGIKSYRGKHEENSLSLLDFISCRQYGLLRAAW